MKPGDKVRFTARWLRSAGVATERQVAYTVQDCGCGLCSARRHVAVDEPAGDWFTADELESEPGLRWRHIAVGNLQPARF